MKKTFLKEIPVSTTILRKIFAIVLFAMIYFLGKQVLSWHPSLVGGVIMVFSAWGILLILFAESLGDYIGLAGSARRPVFIDSKSPPGLVEFLGWTFLLIPLIYLMSVIAKG